MYILITVLICIRMCVAPPIAVGAWSMVMLLWQPVESLDADKMLHKSMKARIIKRQGKRSIVRDESSDPSYGVPIKA